MTDKEYFDKSLEITTEFDRFVINHEEIASKIPNDAIIVFEIEDDPEFTAKSRKIATMHKELNQLVVRVKIKGLLPPLQTRLLEPQIELSAV